eukprot:SAG25_NODE_10502_length_331_cov_1.008621_1_plen_26_part_10
MHVLQHHSPCQGRRRPKETAMETLSQ